jgi:hypothetical protein
MQHWKIRLGEVFYPPDCSFAGDPEAGGRPQPALLGRAVYVVERIRQAGAVGYRAEGGNTSYRLHDAPPTSNRGVARERGWLGTTDDLYRWAHGRWWVVGWSRSHLHLASAPGVRRSAPAGDAAGKTRVQERS